MQLNLINIFKVQNLYLFCGKAPLNIGGSGVIGTSGEDNIIILPYHLSFIYVLGGPQVHIFYTKFETNYNDFCNKQISYRTILFVEFKLDSVI